MEEFCDFVILDVKLLFVDGGFLVKRGVVCMVVDGGRIMLGLVMKVFLSF